MRAPKQSSKTDIFLWITLWEFKITLWDLDSGTLRENEFDIEEKPLQVPFLPNSADTNAVSIFWNKIIE